MNSQHQPETLKIVIEEVTDSFRIFHTSFELTALPGQQVSRHETPEEGEWSPLAMEAAQLPGVEAVLVRPYGLGVHKAVAWDWNVVAPPVKQLLIWVGSTFDARVPPKSARPARRMMRVEA